MSRMSSLLPSDELVFGTVNERSERPSQAVGVAVAAGARRELLASVDKVALEQAIRSVPGRPHAGHACSARAQASGSNGGRSDSGFPR